MYLINILCVCELVSNAAAEFLGGEVGKSIVKVSYLPNEITEHDHTC